MALLDCINYSNPPITASPLGMFCLLGSTPNPDKGGRTLDSSLVRMLDTARCHSPIQLLVLWQLVMSTVERWRAKFGNMSGNQCGLL